MKNDEDELQTIGLIGAIDGQRLRGRKHGTGI